MPIIYTKHARIRLKQRELEERLVEETVLHPDRVLSGMFGRSLAQKDFGDKTLEVVFVREKEDLLIITEYFIEEGK